MTPRTWFAFAFAASTSLLAAPVSAQYAHPRGQAIAGISCDELEGQRIHIHQHLAIYDHGRAVDVPYNVGRPHDAPCLYWLHTHTPDGIIHIEAPVNRSFTLGDFFDVWVQPLSRSEAAGAQLKTGEAMRVWVDGRVYAGDPRAIKLGDHTDIVIEVGAPFITPKPFTAWNGAQ
ncbi:MAG TPA: hypothetical protein VL157_07100 [Gemmatimonadaceae bacterium]|nr:hypothetical protein [Gemmatimonadaceae bacterium]